MLRHRQLADIVQHGGGLQRFHFQVGEIQFFGDFGGVDLDALQMIVSGLVLGVDGHGESLDGAKVERRNILRVLFFVLAAGRGKNGNRVQDVNAWQRQHGRLPAEASGQTHGIPRRTRLPSKKKGNAHR